MLGFHAITEASFASLTDTLGHVSTVVGTTALGTALGKANADATISSAASATTSLGSLSSVTGTANIFPTGIAALGQVGNEVVWSIFADFPSNTYSNITTGASQTWTEILP